MVSVSTISMMSMGAYVMLKVLDSNEGYGKFIWWFAGLFLTPIVFCCDVFFSVAKVVSRMSQGSHTICSGSAMAGAVSGFELNISLQFGMPPGGFNKFWFLPLRGTKIKRKTRAASIICNMFEKIPRISNANFSELVVILFGQIYREFPGKVWRAQPWVLHRPGGESFQFGFVSGV